jgi:hypothetical protein
MVGAINIKTYEIVNDRIEINKMDINQSNIDSFNKSENQYAKNIDTQLNSDVIHKEFFLNNEVINHLNTFKGEKIEFNKNLNSEMINLKAKKYSSDLSDYSAINMDLLFRIKMRIEKLIEDDKMYILQELSDDQIFTGKINNPDGNPLDEFIRIIGFDWILEKIYEIRTKQMKDENAEQFTKEDAFELFDELL